MAVCVGWVALGVWAVGATGTEQGAGSASWWDWTARAKLFWLPQCSQWQSAPWGHSLRLERRPWQDQRGTLSTAQGALGQTSVSLAGSSIVSAKPSLALLWLQSSCALEGREALLGETLSPAQSRGCGQARCHRALQKGLW